MTHHPLNCRCGECPSLGAVAGGCPDSPSRPYLFPLPGGYFTSLYGSRISPRTKLPSFHHGADMGKHGQMGAEIVAPEDGEVIRRNDNINLGQGRSINVRHPGGWVTKYFHLLTSPFKVGDKVKRGEVIAYMGSTGSSTAPHLHQELWNPCGKRVDPLMALSGSFKKKVVKKVGGKTVVSFPFIVKGEYGSSGILPRVGGMNVTPILLFGAAGAAFWAWRNLR